MLRRRRPGGVVIREEEWRVGEEDVLGGCRCWCCSTWLREMRNSLLRVP